MKLVTLLFCFGAGMLQNAMERTQGHVYNIKLWIFWSVNVIAIAATVAELVFAFRAFRWWGFLICYGFFGLPDFMFRRSGSNPAPFFFVGLVATIVATMFILLH